MQVDSLILQCVINAYNGGRMVDLHKILCHELMPIPLDLAEVNGHLKIGNNYSF